MIDLSNLITEQRNPITMNLDEMTPLEIAAVMNQEDLKVVQAVSEVLPSVAQAIEWCTESLRRGGRILYVGAGTSGRLGLLDAAECQPTFGVSDNVVVGLIAGGQQAFTKAVEGAEDSQTLGIEDLKRLQTDSRDTVVGLAASGRTPYVIHALRYAKTIGCRTVGIACNKDSEVGKEADLAIEAVCGPEILTGSTRLKSGTAQKMILNILSTGSMVGIGKAYQNLMVDVVQTNEKLVSRAENIVMTATECSRSVARDTLGLANGSVKAAIVMVKLSCDAEAARERLAAAGGHVKFAIHME